jgi:hydrogenase assembly chaperone HypC/HupF
VCLGRPGRVLRRRGAMVEVETGGRPRWYSTLARPEVMPGDLVLTHASLVLAVLSPSEAAEMEEAFAELAVLAEGGGNR